MTPADDIKDHAHIAAERRRWEAALVWMAAQTPPILVEQLGLAPTRDAAGGTGIGT